MKSIVFVTTWILVNISFSQKEILVFHLTKPESNISVSTADTVFRVGERNVFTVTSTGNEKITRVEVLNGKVFRIKPGLYDVVFSTAGPSFIKVYVQNPKEEYAVGLVHPIRVLGLPEVDLFLCGVKADSALDLKQLIQERQLEARMRSDSFDYKPTVLSFALVLQTDTLRINGNKIPFEYKNRLYELEPGSILEIVEAHVMLPNETKNIVKMPRFSVFVVDTENYSVGSPKKLSPAED